MKEKYGVYLNGKMIILLNPVLVQRQGITDEQLEALKASHVVGFQLKELAKQHLKEPLILKMLAKMFDELEFEQQKLWGFDPNPDMHRFFDFPGCTCPKLDNMDKLGTPFKVINTECPIHGGNGLLIELTVGLPYWITLIKDTEIIFDGTQEMWSKTYFSNATLSEIKDAVQNDVLYNDVELKYREMTKDELEQFPTAQEFCNFLVSSYGEF